MPSVLNPSVGCAFITAVSASASLVAAAGDAVAGPTAYEIVDLGVLDPGDFGSQGFRASPGGVAVGRTLGVSNQGFQWTVDGGTVGLPNLATRPFGVANDANDSGLVVGTGASTAFGAGAIPLIWTNGVVSQLPLPAGAAVGRGNGINAAGVAVGSVGGGTAERGVIYADGVATVITQTTPGGAFITTAFGINDSGLVVGTGVDPANAARNVGFLFDTTSGTASEVGALPGRNGAIAFAVSNGGHVVGSSQQNQGSGVPFIWTQADGIQPIPLPAGTSQGSARGVNSDGWAVGTASNAFAIPFLYDGVQTVRIQDLLPPMSGWDVSMNTSSSALGISDTGIIVGTGVFNGEVRAYALVPIDDACDADFDGSGNADIFDILAFLAAWELGDPETDLNENGSSDIFDILDFLAVWELGCPEE